MGFCITCRQRANSGEAYTRSCRVLEWLSVVNLICTNHVTVEIHHWLKLLLHTSLATSCVWYGVQTITIQIYSLIIRVISKMPVLEKPKLCKNKRNKPVFREQLIGDKGCNSCAELHWKSIEFNRVITRWSLRTIKIVNWHRGKIQQKAGTS